jgi:L-asparaginase II
MSNPVLVEVTRGALVESGHRGAFAVIDGDGALVAAAGDIDRPVYPRSAIKAIQALALVESGAADRYGFQDRHLALACASHNGEAAHVALADEMLARAGRAATDLECGAHWPLLATATRDLARLQANPSSLHNNCSGKHAGFVCLACAMDEDPAGYTNPDHPVQREVRAALEDVTGTDLSDEALRGTDGCSAPTWAIAVRALAHGFARLATGTGLGRERARAGRRLIHACMAAPFEVAGTARFDTDVMALLSPKVFLKTGAEGVYCAALPGFGYGIALKIDDGATRAAEVAMAALIARFVPMGEDTRMAFARFLSPTLVNWMGTSVGMLRPAATLSDDGRPAPLLSAPGAAAPGR